MFLKVLTLGLYIGSVFAIETFDKIVDDFWEWRMENNPEFASNVGDKRYTDKLEDYSLETMEIRKTDMETFLKRLSDVNRNSLSPGERVTFAVLNDTIETWMDGYKWRFYGPMNPISFLEGIQTNYGSRAGQVKFDHENDFRMFAKRIQNYGVQIDQIIARMTKAIDMGTTNHRVSIEKVPAKLEEIHTMYINERSSFPMYEPFKEKLDEIVTNVTLKSEIQKVADDNIKVLLDQMKKLAEYLRSTYIPNTRTSFGVGGLPQGAEYYMACLKWQLSADMTADEIHETGIREVNRIYADIAKIVRRANFNGTVREYNDFLRKNESLFITDGDVAIQKFSNLYNKTIVPKLQELFENIPEFPLKIEKMTYDGPSGIYKNAAADGSRPGVFYANVNSKVPIFDMPALLLHETDPGHHLQDSYAQTAKNLSLFRKVTDFSKYFATPLNFPFYTGYSEGWGLYSEELGEELHIYKNDLEMFGKYGLEIFRAARLVVDTGIHAKNWSRARAIEYMTDYTAYTPEFIAREIDRYSTWPAQATTYMIGKLKILALRKKAEDKLCNFERDKLIRPFHSVVVGSGAMPLRVLESEVTEWIKKESVTSKVTCAVTDGVDKFHNTQSLVVFITILVAMLHSSEIFTV